MACRQSSRIPQLLLSARLGPHPIVLPPTITFVRCMSEEQSPSEQTKQAWTKDKAAWISAARREIKKSRVALDDLDNTFARLEKKQEWEEHQFRMRMREIELREPKPEDYGLPIGWQPKEGPDDFGMGRWRG